MLLVVGLFALGRTSYAVGLFSDPWDKAAHVAVFALLTVLLYRAFGARAAWLAALLALGVGVADEYHQSFLAGRSSDLKDMIADGVGVAVAVATLRRVGKARRSRAPHFV